MTTTQPQIRKGMTVKTSTGFVGKVTGISRSGALLVKADGIQDRVWPQHVEIVED